MIQACPGKKEMTLTDAMMKYPAVFTIYRDLPDYPGRAVVRIWYGNIPCPECSAYMSIGQARLEIQARGARMCLGRAECDNPCIVESWV